MSRALIVTDADMSWPAPDRFARIEQLAELYRGLGLAIDLLVMTHPAQRDGRARLPETIERLARVDVSAENMEGGGPTLRLAEGAEALGGAGRHRLVHFDAVLPRWPGPDGALRVFDARDIAVTGEAPQADLIFASLEPVRSAPCFQSLRSVRLPLPCSSVLQRPGTGPMVGWPGACDAAMARGWEDVLDVLARHGERLLGGLLLADTPVSPTVPPLLARVRAGPEAYRHPVSHRALGLGVLPTVPGLPFDFEVTELIARRCPVLTTPEVAAVFEDRWHLPTADSAEGLADWIRGWTAGRHVTEFAEAAEATRLAMVHDFDAMTRYASHVIADAMAGR